MGFTHTLFEPLRKGLHDRDKLRGYLPDIALRDVFRAVHDVIELLIGHAGLPAEDVIGNGSGLLSNKQAADFQHGYTAAVGAHAFGKGTLNDRLQETGVVHIEPFGKPVLKGGCSRPGQTQLLCLGDTLQLVLHARFDPGGELHSLTF